MKKHWLWLVVAVFTALLLCGAAAAETFFPYLGTFPRESIAVGDSLEYEFGDFDPAEDQYVHVLREEADGTYSVVAVVLAWDAAAKVSVQQIEPGVITDTGNYWLTLGTDPDYAGLDEEAVASTPFTVLEKKLAAPAFESVVHGSTVGTDVSGTVSFPEGTVMGYIEVGRMEDGVFISEYWDNGGTHFNALGLFTTVPGTYQVRASAHAQWFGEPAETMADSDVAVYEFTLADGDIPECPTPVLSVTEADYDPNRNRGITYTVPGAEAVAYAFNIINPATREDVRGTGMPASSTPGDTGSFLDGDGPGEYHVSCWGRFNGVWSTPGEAVLMLNPIGYLDVPVVAWQDSPVEDALQISGTDPVVFTVTCEGAETLFCEVQMKLINGDYDWLEWLEFPVSESGTATTDLSELFLPEGTYKLRFTPDKAGWLIQGVRTITLTIGEAPDNP